MKHGALPLRVLEVKIQCERKRGRPRNNFITLAFKTSIYMDLNWSADNKGWMRKMSKQLHYPVYIQKNLMMLILIIMIMLWWSRWLRFNASLGYECPSTFWDAHYCIFSLRIIESLSIHFFIFNTSRRPQRWPVIIIIIKLLVDWIITERAEWELMY